MGEGGSGWCEGAGDGGGVLGGGGVGPGQTAWGLHLPDGAGEAGEAADIIDIGGAEHIGKAGHARVDAGRGGLGQVVFGGHPREHGIWRGEGENLGEGQGRQAEHGVGGGVGLVPGGEIKAKDRIFKAKEQISFGSGFDAGGVDQAGSNDAGGTGG